MQGWDIVPYMTEQYHTSDFYLTIDASTEETAAFVIDNHGRTGMLAMP